MSQSRRHQDNWRQRDNYDDFSSSRRHQDNWRQRDNYDDFSSSRRHQGNWRQRNDEGLFWRGRGRGRGCTAERGFSDDCFLVLDSGRYEGEAPPLLPPTVLGSFSVDSEKNILYDNSMMPVLNQMYIPDGELMKVNMDLNRGWHRVSNFTATSADGFRNLLQWILKNQEKVRAEDSSDRLAADFVCSRRMLKQIMQAPYTHPKHMYDQWKILAKHFKGTIYLTSEVPEKEKHKDKAGGSSLTDIHGPKFEQYMTGGDPDDVLETDCQFRCVLLLHLNEMSLLFAPDMDAVDPTRHKEDFKDLDSFVRLKAQADLTSPCHRDIYQRYFLNNWWTENKLAGVPRLLVGRRDRDGVVRTLEMLQTDDLPRLAEGKWEPSVCINALDQFLSFVKRRVLAEPDAVHCFEKFASPRRDICHYCDPNLEDILPSLYKQKLFTIHVKERGCNGGSS